MMKGILGLFAGVLTAAVLFTPFRVAAYSPFDAVDCGGKAASSTVCKSQGNTSNPVYGSDSILIKVTNLIAVFAGVIAVFIIVIAGGRFVTSGGDSNNVSTAKNTILYALIGIVVIILARTIIVYVINHLK